MEISIRNPEYISGSINRLYPAVVGVYQKKKGWNRDKNEFLDTVF
jgi:hypothetical protein